MSDGLLDRPRIFIGCAGWSIAKPQQSLFPESGSHLGRFAQRLPAVEINSSFYRPHKPSTYARWAAETPGEFAFAVKVPKHITHELRLVDTDAALERFLEETALLESKRGPLLVQLPPSFPFDARIVVDFFSGLRRRFDGRVACEPRHRSWFVSEADALLAEFRVARVAADPAVVAEAAEPGGWRGLTYVRWHGSPRIYYSAYSPERLSSLADSLVAWAEREETWCIFDNTALGAATEDALTVLSLTDRLLSSKEQSASPIGG